MGTVTGSIAADPPADPGAAQGRSAPSEGTPQLVIFDLDGTLTDSALGIVASFLHALSHIGAAVPEGDLAARSSARPWTTHSATMGLGERRRGGVRGLPRRVWRAGLGDEYPCSKGSGHCWPICGPPVSAWLWPPPNWNQRRSASSRISDWTIISRSLPGQAADGSRKTKTEVLGHALAQLQPLPERVLMVGDRSHDVDGAAAHGIDTVVVGWGYGRADFAPCDDASPATSVTHVATVDELRRAFGV